MLFALRDYILDFIVIHLYYEYSPNAYFALLVTLMHPVLVGGHSTIY